MTRCTYVPVAIHANSAVHLVKPRRTRSWSRVARCDVLLLGFATLIAMAGLGAGDVLTSDFTPCWGAPQGPTDQPSIGRVLIASSSNGVDFQRPTDPKLALVVDRVGVPDAVVLPSGRILLYFVAGCKYYVGAEHKVDQIAVAVSDTDASSWAFKNVEFIGIPGNFTRPVDPNVVLLPGGQLSLFGTMWVEQDSKARIYSFLSTDGGFTYTFQGLRYDPVGSPDGIIDPENYRFSDTNWQILTGGSNGHALSTDGGNTFTSLGLFSEMYVPHEVSATDTPGSFRVYAPGPGALAINSYRSDTAPWTAWTLEAGDRLTLSTNSAMESCEVVFPTVVKTASHGYLLLYQTIIPGCSCHTSEFEKYCSRPPVIAIAGWGTTSLNAVQSFQAVAVVSDPESDVTEVELLLNDQPTDITLNDSGSGGDAIAGDGVWSLQLSPITLPPGTYLVGMRARDASGNTSDVWPYLTVSDQRRLEVNQYPTLDSVLQTFETALDAMGVNPTSSARILAAGFVDSTLSGTQAGRLRALARADSQFGVQSVELRYGGQPTGLTLRDDGTGGDLQGGDSYFTISFEDLPPAVPAGRYLFELRATDNSQNVSTTWPYLTVQ